MEFVEDEARPRFLFRGGGAAPSAAGDPDAGTLKVHKLHAAACLSAASLLVFAAVSLSHWQTLSSFLAWASLSLLLAPFAPPSATGGDPRVGRGPVLPDPPATPIAPSEPDEPRKRNLGRRPRSQPLPSPSGPPSSSVVSSPPISQKPEERSGDTNSNGSGSAKEVEAEKEWTDEDFELLKRQISKHPVGEPRRWERIAEAFRGRHGLDSIIKTAKSLSERKPAAGDSFQQFLKQRKPLDKRVDANVGDSKDEILAENGELGKEGGGGSGSWSAGEDLALLNALKAFPKDVSMRWEKIAAAVPGKSKACCMKRVAELKRDFRSSKASET
ncbi:transcription factor MAMYB [Elaeis guineensis]|uniref:Transcription factor MAMYB n=1 Tax=Elaeis guineensis var. tenera TaxID=51953 RepID=A0A6I9SDC6_ELAGV|nr:transcription factor MAMYB [Elaeis guineensis]XP_010941213.1 transcription factor MAMYB [Elaeis guineensis]